MTLMAADSSSGAGGGGRRSGVKARLTPKRSGRRVENDEYGAFVRRVLRAYSRRVGDGDVEALVLLVGLAEEIDAALAEAVKGLRAYGYSWTEDRLPAWHLPPGRPAALGATVSSAQAAYGPSGQ